MQSTFEPLNFKHGNLKGRNLCISIQNGQVRSKEKEQNNGQILLKRHLIVQICYLTSKSKENGDIV